MHAHRVDIFHIADSYAVSLMVTHDFVLYFFPACYAALNKHLVNPAAVKADFRYLNKFLLIVCKTSAAPPERIRRAYNNRIAYSVGCLNAAFNIFRYFARCNRLPYFLHSLFKKLAVFRLADSVSISAYHLNIMLFKKARFLKLHSEVKGILPAKRRKYAVRIFF